MFSNYKSILCALFTCITFPLAAQDNLWKSPSEFPLQSSKNYIIRSNESSQNLRNYWEIIGVRNHNQYIVSPQKGMNYSHLEFQWKIWDPIDIVNNLYLFRDDHPDEKYNSIVVFSPYISKTQIHNILHDLGIQHPDSDSKFKGINIISYPLTKEEIHKLSTHKYVTSIEPLYDDVALNAPALSITNARPVRNPVLMGGEGLLGKGVVMGIGDDGINTHSDISHRILRQFNPRISGGHAVHVSVTALGNGIIDESVAGFAPQADVINHFFNAVLVYGQSMFEDYNMNLTNNSYAQRTGDCHYAGVYNSTSQAVDEMMYNNPQLFHIFAAGNDGLLTCSPYPTGFGTVVGFYQASKNALVVGNIGSHLQYLYNGSSKGPVRDGRIKPEIGAHGVLLYSGWNDDTYVPNSGTSMAAPNVTGAAALITEKYKQLNSGKLPSSGLLKALLMNGSQDVYNPGPDYYYGFGVMNVRQSISMLKNNQFIEDSISHGGSKSYTINIPAHISKVKVMVYWHDVPAVPTPDDHSTPKLINDIDMRLITPSAATINPWILNPSSPTEPASRGIDRINNVEQISLDFPASGDYTLLINGFNITGPEQKYVIVWDFEINELELLSPVGNEKLSSDDSLRVHFRNPPTSNQFSVELSTNNGTSWTMLSSGIESHFRHFSYLIPSDIHSSECLIRVKENGTSHSATSQKFSISQKPILELNAESTQCPGSISVFWNPVPNALHYILFIHEKGEMKEVDTVNSSTLSYTFSGLVHDEKYEVSVAPLFSSARGIRANAVSRKPNTGSCTASGSPDYDLAVVSFDNLHNGRLYTSLELPENKLITVKVQNRGKNTITTIPLSLVLNDILIVNQVFSLTLNPGQTEILSFNGFPVDLHETGEYSLKVFKTVSSYPDIIFGNDTIVGIVRQIDNIPIDLTEGYVENFSLTRRGYYHSDFIGLWDADRWDYFKSDGWGRLTHFVSSSVSISDSHALTMDLRSNASEYPDSISTNSAVVTLNLSEYNITEKEVRFDFQYRFAGQPKYFLDNAIFIRGKDTDPWLFVSLLDSTAVGDIKRTTDFSINDILLENTQEFSPSTQIKIQQKDTSLIAGVDFGNGLTIDSFRVYAITDDVSLQTILTPGDATCGTSDETITVLVRNNVFYTLHNIPVFYQIDDGPVQEGIIDSIPSKSSKPFTFSTPESFSEYGTYKITAWVNYITDESRSNDTLRTMAIFTPSISQFPYLQTFDSSSADHFYTNYGSAWQSGTPEKGLIKHAANGSISFSTSLISQDTASRISYLYTPCFNTSSMTAPTISFSNALMYKSDNTMNPTKAYIEYSTNGSDWIKLGSKDSGSNWYDNDDNTWSSRSFNWISSSHTLPDHTQLILRFVFESYPGNRDELWAIDDIHIYDRSYNITSIKESYSIDVIHTSGTDSFIYDSDNAITGFIDAETAMGRVNLTSFNHSSPIITASNESLILSNFNVTHDAAKKYKLGIYISHQALVRLWDENNCPSCYKVNSIYESGISTYHSDISAEINNTLTDNTAGVYNFTNRKDIIKIPYDDGYLLIFENQKPGEIWFNSGLPDNHDVSYIPVHLQGEQLMHHYAKLYFESRIDAHASMYILERKNISTGAYTIVAEFSPLHDSVSYYEHIDQPAIEENKAVYRVRYILSDGSTRLTPEITLEWLKNGSFGIYPNPVTEGTMYISWNLDEGTDIEYRIINTTGQTITVKKIDNELKLGFIIININELNIPPGNYYIQLKSNTEKGTLKFIYIQ